MILLGDFVIYVVFVFSVSVVVVSLLVTDPLLARAYGVPVGRRSGGGLAMTLVASINVIIFFFFGTSVRRSSRSAFGRSTGNDVSGHYILARACGVPVGRRSRGRLAMT